ncbi:MAG: methyltransferase domain-containing protein [Salinibacter sp.]
MPPSSEGTVAEHYDRLDRFYRQLWGEHVHHGLWTDPTATPDAAVRHLVHCVAADAGIGAGTDVYDIGCGYGAPARLWAAEYGASVTGYTVSPAQHAYAERQPVDGPAPEYVLRDFLENERPDDSADAAVAIESLTHTGDPASAVREAARLLRPGGRFVACVWMAAPDSPAWARRFLLDPIREEGRLSELPAVPVVHRWATRAGLRVARLDDVTPFVRRTWSVVLRRVVRALGTDPALRQLLLDATESERVFARTLPRIWIAQHLGVLRYGWLVATKA